ncbi:uncharacterized protein [Spinacia oleracea]|uniref:SHSP domain-containing protein n=1 Tax=Spinacia oleracea TaxID=3562 RepID=A0ABM3QVL3_SPIOL|nr:uncharacterized protein LOC130462674 [Spinacia oleracea]
MGQPESGNLPPHPVSSSEHFGNSHHPDSHADMYDGSSSFSSGERTTTIQLVVSFDDLKVVSQRKACYLTEDDDALYLRVDMPGLGKEHTNIYPEDNYTLIVKGVGEVDNFEPKFKDKETCVITYVAKVTSLEMYKYNLDGIQLGMKNGVLKAIVPKIKDIMYGGNSRTTMQLTYSGGPNNESEPNGQRKPWYLTEDDDGLYLRFDMPGVNDREGPFFSYKYSTMRVGVVQLLDDSEPKLKDEETFPMIYTADITLLDIQQYNFHWIHSGFKNGVLKLIVPKKNGLYDLKVSSWETIFNNLGLSMYLNP